ncbi:cation:proton antiporter regulatory subunit [Microbacterium sp.]|uniref:cation:proton antiporter regulatory subunit n=1 Tax=Microbacterium sp. TaxID=51671 RepID=UPI003A836DC5
MPVNVERAELPGIGVRHDLVTAEGRRISIIDYREGGREVAVSDAHDPDRASLTVELTDDEATALSELLGGSLILSQVAGLREQIAGLYTEQVPMRADSPYIGRPLGDTKARTRTRCSIVAIVRETGVLPAPGPEDRLNAGDALIAVGTREGLDALARIINGG